MRLYRMVEAGKVDLTLGESQIDRTGFHFFGDCKRGQSMQHFPCGRRLPRIAILAEAGPLAGDLAACLSGQFLVERVTSAQEAQGALSRGCRALLLTGSSTELTLNIPSLVEQAQALGCRVLLLGGTDPGGEPGAARGAGIRFLPAWPSPQEVLAALAGLSDQLQAGA